MKVTIYCVLIDAENQFALKREVNLHVLPRIGEQIDGLTIDLIRHFSEPASTYLFVGGDVGNAKKAKERILGMKYSECPYDEWFRTRWDRPDPVKKAVEL